MAAEEGNKYAEKWTNVTALEAIAKVHGWSLTHHDNYHIGYALTQNGLYPEIWSYFTEKFEDDPEVFQAIKNLEQLYEQRIVNNTITGKAKSAAMAIFYLKNKHGYEDKHQHEGGDPNKPINWQEVKTYDSNKEADQGS